MPSGPQARITHGQVKPETVNKMAPSFNAVHRGTDVQQNRSFTAVIVDNAAPCLKPHRDCLQLKCETNCTFEQILFIVLFQCLQKTINECENKS